MRAGFCFARSRRGQLGLNLPNKRVVKTLNVGGCVELGGDGRGDCSAVIACWHWGVQQEGHGGMQKQSVRNLK